MAAREAVIEELLQHRERLAEDDQKEEGVGNGATSAPRNIAVGQTRTTNSAILPKDERPVFRSAGPRSARNGQNVGRLGKRRAPAEPASSNEPALKQARRQTSPTIRPRTPPLVNTSFPMATSAEHRGREAEAERLSRDDHAASNGNVPGSMQPRFSDEEGTDRDASSPDTRRSATAR